MDRNSVDYLVTILCLAFLLCVECLILILFPAYLEIGDFERLITWLQKFSSFSEGEIRSEALWKWLATLFYCGNFAILEARVIYCHNKHLAPHFENLFRVVIYLYSGIFSFLDLITKEIGISFPPLTGVELPVLVSFISIDSAISIYYSHS